MSRIRMDRLVGGLIAATVLSLGGTAYGQAWVGPENSLDFGLSYHFSDQNGTFGGQQGKNKVQSEDADAINTHILEVGGEYTTPVRGLAVAARAYILKPNFVGDESYLPHGSEHVCMDGMCTYPTPTELTDFQMDARYQIPASPGGFAITPLAGISVPLTDYPVIGHAGYGKHLMEARVGLDVGRTFDPVLPRAYFDASYTYAFVEDVDATPLAEEFGNNRSDARLLLGYFVLPNLSLFTGGLYRHVHGGFSWAELAEPIMKKVAGEELTPMDKTKLLTHDQLAAERAWTVHGGISYQPIPKLSLQATALKIVKGDSVPNIFAVSFGASWKIF